MKTNTTHDKPGEFRAILDSEWRKERNGHGDTARIQFDVSAGIEGSRAPADAYISIESRRFEHKRSSSASANLDLDEMRALHDSLGRAIAAADIHGSAIGDD